MTPVEVDWGRVRAVLFDMDGVLYRGRQALPGVNTLLAYLRDRSILYACVTNNASMTTQQYTDKLAGLGIAMPPERIITSAIATNVWLRTRAPRGTTVYPIGMEGLRTALFGDGYFVEHLDGEPTPPEYVVAGADFELTYAKLRTACLAIRAGAQFIGTNPDTTLPMELGIAPGIGAIILAIEAATGVKATIIGKPERAMFDTALHMLGVAARDALMVGDRLDTDILGAARAGLPTALVLTGVSTVAELEHSEAQPDAVFEDLPHLLAHWQRIEGMTRALS